MMMMMMMITWDIKKNCQISLKIVLAKIIVDLNHFLHDLNFKIIQNFMYYYIFQF